MKQKPPTCERRKSKGHTEAGGCVLCSLCWAELPSACPALSMPHGGCAKPAANICILLPFHFGAPSTAGGWGSMLPRGAAVATTGRASYAHASKCVITALACAKKKSHAKSSQKLLEIVKATPAAAEAPGSRSPRADEGCSPFLVCIAELQAGRRAGVLGRELPS